MDQGLSRHRRHRLDGGNALFAAALRLPLRGRERLRAVGNLQDHGAEAVTGHHHSGHGRNMAIGSLAGLART